MRYFLDCEFVDQPKESRVLLVSLGLVADSGPELYLENRDVDLRLASDWFNAHVTPSLEGAFWSKEAIATAVQDFVELTRNGEKPEFWGWYSAYDWVVLTQALGGLLELPRSWPLVCYDLKQLCDCLGNPRLPEKCGHHALQDARWNRDAFYLLQDLAGGEVQALPGLGGLR